MKDISERNFYFDFLRGFAIVMVVGIHSMTNTHPDFGAVEGFLHHSFEVDIKLCSTSVPCHFGILYRIKEDIYTGRAPCFPEATNPQGICTLPDILIAVSGS